MKKWLTLCILFLTVSYSFALPSVTEKTILEVHKIEKKQSYVSAYDVCAPVTIAYRQLNLNLDRQCLNLNCTYNLFNNPFKTIKCKPFEIKSGGLKNVIKKNFTSVIFKRYSIQS